MFVPHLYFSSQSFYLCVTVSEKQPDVLKRTFL